MSDFDKELDTSGLNCPLPIIKAKKEINTMDSGQVLYVISTDPGAVKDFESFANQTGNELLSSEETATFETLKQNKIPIRILKISSLNEYDIGNLLMHFFLETIYTCYLLKVNPFDQPAVEEGKKLAIKILKET